MGSKFSFPYVGICSDVPKCKFSLKKERFKILVLLPSIFVADTKIIYGYKFVAPLIIYLTMLELRFGSALKILYIRNEILKNNKKYKFLNFFKYIYSGLKVTSHKNIFNIHESCPECYNMHHT